MGSSFAGISTALSGIYAARRGLDLTGQNVANANTEGYTRQRLVLDAQGAPTTPAFFSRYDGVGSGAAISDVQRLRDSFVEGRGHTEHGRNSYLATRSQALAQVEDIISEPGDAGLAAQMSEFWNSWQDLANSPGDGAARTQLMQRANTVADSLHNMSDNLETQWQGTRAQLEALVNEVNTTAGTLSELNVAIRRDSQANIPSSELEDQRDKLIMKLADQIGATVKPNTDGGLDVYVGGTALVRGSTVQKLQVSGASVYDQTLAVPPTAVAVSWVSDGYPAAVELGEAAGQLDALNSILPGYATKLNNFTASLVGNVNAVHSAGYGADGVNGRNFFSGITADTISVAVLTTAEIGASKYPGGVIDGGQADLVAKLDNSIIGPGNDYRQLIVQLGTDAQTANRRASIQTTITTQVDATRESQSGVDLDEEMTNMLAFQHAYEAAARVLTAVDEALDILINRTGLVGR